MEQIFDSSILMMDESNDCTDVFPSNDYCQEESGNLFSWVDASEDVIYCRDVPPAWQQQQELPFQGSAPFMAAPETHQVMSVPVKQEPIVKQEELAPTPFARPAVSAQAPTVNACSPSPCQTAMHYDVDRLEDLNDHQLATIEFKSLLALMAKANLSDAEVAEVKARRRRLKNRLSARVCSNKKREKCTELEYTNVQLERDLSDLQKANHELKQQNEQYKQMQEMYSKEMYEKAQENEELKKQIEQLTSLLLQAGIMSSPVDASFAA
jgi:superfamily II RNA helicase